MAATKDDMMEREADAAVAFVAHLAPEDAARFCEHHRYVGYKGALRFMCPRCNPDGKL